MSKRDTREAAVIYNVDSAMWAPGQILGLGGYKSRLKISFHVELAFSQTQTWRKLLGLEHPDEL
jgi:hypothetical protein